MGDYLVSPLWHISRLEKVIKLTILSPSLRSVKFSRSDALPTAQPVYTYVLWLRGVGQFFRSPGLGICWAHSTLKEYDIGRPMNK